MDNYELYLQNDADRMNQELQQYQLLLCNRIPEEEPISSSGSDFQYPPKENFSSSNLLNSEPETLKVENSVQTENIQGRKRKQTRKPASRIEKVEFDLVKKKETKSKNIHKKDKSTKNAGKMAQYPTKNFLQNFKGAHYDYLKKFFSEDHLKKYPAVEHLRGKKSVSRSLYQSLYSIPEFHPAFEKMFSSKYLYRSMMLSRSELAAKKNHEKKIDVLEEAFRSQTFLKIN